MLRIGLLASLIAISGAQAATCYTVDNLAGHASRRADGLKLDPDSFAGQSFQVSIDGRNSRVTAWDSPCAEVTADTVMCQRVDQAAGTISVEMWAIDQATRRVMVSRMRSGFGPYDGGALFVGRLAGRCQVFSKGN